MCPLGDGSPSSCTSVSPARGGCGLTHGARLTWTLGVMLTAGVLLGGGCASWRGSSKAEPELPPVVVTGLTPELGAEGGRFLLELEVDNPVAREAAVNQVDWEVWLEGRYFAAGTQALEETLPPGGRRKLTLSLPVALRRPVLSEPRTVRAAVRGVLLVQRTGFDRALRFEGKLMLERARVPLPGLTEE